MELLLQRRKPVEDAIIGKLAVNGVFECWTCERVGVEIAPGRYPVTITPSARFGRMLPLIGNVPGRSGIRIHSGNVPGDSEGCVLVGQSETPDSVLSSKLALGALQPKIAGAQARGEPVWIDVRNAVTVAHGS